MERRLCERLGSRRDRYGVGLYSEHLKSFAHHRCPGALAQRSACTHDLVITSLEAQRRVLRLDQLQSLYSTDKRRFIVKDRRTIESHQYSFSTSF